MKWKEKQFQSGVYTLLYSALSLVDSKLQYQQRLTETNRDVSDRTYDQCYKPVGGASICASANQKSQNCELPCYWL